MFRSAYTSQNVLDTVLCSYRAEVHGEVIFYRSVVPKGRLTIFEGGPQGSSLHDLLLPLESGRLFPVSKVPRTTRVSAAGLVDMADKVAPSSAVDLCTTHWIDAP